MKKERRRFVRQSARAVLLVLMLVFMMQTLVIVSAADQVPLAPSELTATVDFTIITLAWKDNSFGVASFKIDRKDNDGIWEEYASVEATLCYFHDKQVYTGETYAYRVRAVITTIENGVEVFAYSGYSNEANGTIESVLAPPNLIGTLGPNSITLTWRDNSNNEDGFMIIKHWANGTQGDTFQVKADVTNFVDNDISAGYAYSYEIIAYIDVPVSLYEVEGLGAIRSEPSNTVNVIVPLDYMPTTSTYRNFVKTRTYSTMLFIDINEDAWYGLNNQKSVAMVYEYGLMAGYTDQTFKPDGNLSIAEAITIATRIYCIYSTGNQLEFDPIPDAPWYQGNINYAIEKDIIEADVFENYASIATRAQMAYIFAHALPDPEDTYSQRYEVKLPPDVDESAPFYVEIMMLYRAGIVGGSDSLGTFHPNSNITRAQAAAIITRLVDYNSRLGDTFHYPGFTS